MHYHTALLVLLLLPLRPWILQIRGPRMVGEMNNFRTGTQLRAHTSRVPSSRPGDRSRARTHVLPPCNCNTLLPFSFFHPRFISPPPSTYSSEHQCLKRVVPCMSYLSHTTPYISTFSFSISLTLSYTVQITLATAMLRELLTHRYSVARRSTILVSFIFHYGAIILGLGGFTHRVSDKFRTIYQYKE